MSKIGIKGLIKESGPYKNWALEQRKEFMELRLDQDAEIVKIYEEASRNIAREVARGNKNRFEAERLKRVQLEIKSRIDELNGQLTINFEKHIERNVDAGSYYAKKVTLNIVENANITKMTKPLINQAFYKMNANAVEAIWSRSRFGLTLNEQIWNKNQNYRKNINKILISGVATGEDCVTVARSIEKYVKKGAKSFAKDYPNMMSRMKGRVPEDISYEALRLARTEMTSAYGLSTMKTATLNPSNRGVKFMLSASHPEWDICDIHCGRDDYDLGPGGYPLDKAPDYPFHPNCLCIMTQINEEPDSLLERLKAWDKDPSSQPDLEEWYQENYE